MAVAPESAPDVSSPARDVAPRWPLWMPIAALAGGVSLGFVTVGMLSAVLDSTGLETNGDGPWLTNAGTVLIDLAVVGACVMLAAATLRPRAWHFGLRGGPLGATAAAALVGMVAFFLFELTYNGIVEPKNAQKVVDDLGAETNTGLLVAAAVVVIVVAPICEELFFRGVLFRVLRTRLPLAIAAIGDGILFGLVHYQSGALAILPILAFLGVVLCYVLDYTGTLFATIAIHALNNAISYGFLTDDGWTVAVPLGVLMLGGCAFGVARAARGVPPAVANPPARLDLPSPG